MASFRLAVGTIICLIRIRVTSELIIAAIAAATEVQSKAGGGFEILENTFGGGEMAVERSGIVSAKCSDCK